MTERPYTDADLRAEAARQHAALTEDPDFVGVGEQMEDARVGSVEAKGDGSGRTWAELLADEGDWDGPYEEAQGRIHDLINAAADVSDWAVALGADGLEPSDGVLSLKGDDKPIVRVHFAFDPDMPDEMRESFIEGVGSEIARYL
ncbi:hypothetical protein ACFCWD_28890 [Streptomyces sp. NPDC056374]|uniref:hypothetical protein n=1 Tax=unclassified Streptomyces TaxID=2593676 RepID=UPI0035DD44D6